MKDFKGSRNSGGSRGGFGGDRGGSRGGFGGHSSFGGDRGGSRGGFGGRGGREFDRPEMFKAVCSECGNDCEVPFRPSGSKPVLCSSCFAIQKGGNDSRSFGGRERSFDSAPVRTMYKAVCQDCGAPCEVPFRPTDGKPVYCSDCFGGRESTGRPEKHFEKHADKHDDFGALNAKLDQIISLLKSTVAPEEKYVMTPKVEKEVKKETIVPKAEKEEVEKKVKKSVKAEVSKKEKAEVKVKAVKVKKPAKTAKK